MTANGQEAVRSERVRAATGALIRRADEKSMAALAVALNTAAGAALTEAEGAAAVKLLAPAMVDALALAFQREADELVPINDCAAVLGATSGGLLKAAAAGRLKLELVRRGGRPHVRRGELDTLLRRSTPAVDPLVSALAGALSAAMPAARELAEPPLTMSAAEAGARLGMSRKQLWGRVEAGTLDLKPIHVGGRVVRFSAADVARAARQK